jgi:asparagine synthase (glutamine-hydrolysing)
MVGMRAYLNKLDTILSNLFSKYSSIGDLPGVLLSGGIDSSIISYYVGKTFPAYHIFSMGTLRTKDKKFIDIMTAYLKHDYCWIHLSDEMIRENMGTVEQLLKDVSVPRSLMQMSLAMGYFLIFKEAHKRGVTRVFTGQGPDITFAGYHKYKSTSDVQAEIMKDLPILAIDQKRDTAMAAHFGITLINPYLEKDMVDFALHVPPGYKIRNGVEKFLLREYAKSIGLPHEIADRPKKAFQYSTGLQQTVRKYYNITI